MGTSFSKERKTTSPLKTYIFVELFKHDETKYKTI
jgi:hypothetical protein